MHSTRPVAICLILAWVFSSLPALGQTTAPATQRSDLTGTWDWIQRGTFMTSGRSVQGNQTRPAPAGIPPNSRLVTLTLTQDGEKLSGFLTNYGPNRPEIQEASFKDGVITFQIIQVLNPQTAVRIGRPEREVLSTYKGKVDGNVIRGTIWRGLEGSAAGGEPWEATRQPPP